MARVLLELADPTTGQSAAEPRSNMLLFDRVTHVNVRWHFLESSRDAGSRKKHHLPGQTS